MTIRSKGGAVAAAAALAFVMWTPLAGAQGETSQAEESGATSEPREAPEAAPAGATSGAEQSAASWPADEGVEPAMPAAPAEPGLSGDEPSYVIGAADVVRVMVWRNPDLSAEVPVRPDGRISVPLLGDVPAAGLTTAELRDVIASRLSEYIQAPDVTVSIAQVNSKVVYLVGEVVRPMALPLNRRMRVLDAIAVAGGFSPFADTGDIKILRSRPDGTVEEHEFNYGRFLRGKAPESNLVLQPDDTIVVPD